jgi:predicted metal-dependent HD superfamily phosphohydrolase
MKIEELIMASRSWYAFKGSTRFYHNWKHATRVAKATSFITNARSAELILAAWWHDAVYVPGAGSNANELCSAAALIQTARNCSDGDMAIVNRAAELIRRTDIRTHMHDTQLIGDIAILLDADLSSLAGDYYRFGQTQAEIHKENPGATPKDSVVFLQQLVGCREYIYHTDYAREYWEADAKNNIKRYTNDHE